MIVSFTGHRPERLPHDAAIRMDATMGWLQHTYSTSLHVVAGMAQGWDTLAARAAIKFKVPFTAAIPWKGHGQGWPREHLDAFRELCMQAERAVIVCDTDEYRPWVYQKRDEWMVDNSAVLITAWDGIREGGTWNTIQYAIKRQRKMVHIYEIP
jgi:uncharacterized phage-like protein YoqJ